MNSQHATLEIIAPSVEEAIEKGLTDLGLPSDAVDVEVLDEGSRGLFGLGARQARVRLLVREAVPAYVKEAAPAPVQEAAPVVIAPRQEEAQPPKETVEAVAPADLTEEDGQALQVAQDTVSELLGKMKVQAKVTSHFGQPDEAKNRAPIIVDIQGDDLSILIGKRSETLNALQYITSLIVGKELGHTIPLVIDVQGYRARRDMQIRQIGRRVAEQVIKTGRRQALEPMPANERRIIHMELRNHPDVFTESTGEEPYRKVNIIPKK